MSTDRFARPVTVPPETATYFQGEPEQYTGAAILDAAGKQLCVVERPTVRKALAAARQIADAINANGWIDVNDALPDDDLMVLVFIADERGTSWPAYHDDNIWMGDEGLPLNRPVTHWRELPDAPVGFDTPQTVTEKATT